MYTDEAASLDVTPQDWDKLWVSACIKHTYTRTLNICIYRITHTHIHDLIKVLVSAYAHLRFLGPVKGCVCVCVCVYFHGEMCVFPWSKARTCKLSDDSLVVCA